MLLIKVVLVAVETSFALKGGTGINLFLRDMPRLLSISISPTFPSPIARLRLRRSMPAWQDRQGNRARRSGCTCEPERAEG